LDWVYRDACAPLSRVGTHQNLENILVYLVNYSTFGTPLTYKSFCSADAMSTSELSIAFVYAGDVLAAAITLPVVGLIAVSIRLWMRRWDAAWARIDDWLIVGALVSRERY
jgi:hypothetical protein